MGKLYENGLKQEKDIIQLICALQPYKVPKALVPLPIDRIGVCIIDTLNKIAP